MAFLRLMVLMFCYSRLISFTTAFRVSALRAASTAASGQSPSKIVARYTVTPIKLFRICGAKKSIVLREHAKQLAKGSRAYDYTGRPDGLIHPAPLDGTFIGPNGASFRPATINMWDVLSQRKGANVIEIPENSQLPEDLVMLHERDDHYSLQGTRPMKPSELTKKMNAWIEKFEMYPKDTYFERYPLPHV